LVIAGKVGWKHRAIFREIKRSQKSAKISYIGYVAEADKLAVIKLAKMLVYPSFYEGFGFQPLEAMSVGTPVIASQVSALPEVTGGAALLVDPYRVDDLAEAVNLLSTNRILREELISRGREQVKGYSWTKAAGLVLAELNAL
ncbi:MAG: glycosyltransferase, partial [Patescibacteria group bacterium]|nr:glycosyltransferase [Patescibacteria group bacterium]